MIDFWTGAFDDNQETRPCLAERLYRDIEPLGPQFGVDPKQDVPDALLDAMFGGDTSIQTYAILDAGLFQGLEAILEASGLEYRCLLNGEAYTELQDVAPFLVQLKPNNGFTRGLFTRGKGPADRFDTNAGIFIRSELAIDAVKAHFRKFTRIRDSKGAWLYFRFWDPNSFHPLTKILAADPSKASAFLPPELNTAIYRLPNRADYREVRVSTDAPKAAPFVLNAREEAVFRGFARYSQVVLLQDAAEKRVMDADPAMAKVIQNTKPSVRFGHAKRMYKLGMLDAKTNATLLAIIYSTGMNILQEPAFDYAVRNPLLSPTAKARQLIMSFKMISKLKEE